jgi:hypothetical protein
MDYELMMNGSVRIGMKAPDFEAVTTRSNSGDFSAKMRLTFGFTGNEIK